MTKIKVEISKIGLNPDSRFALLQDDFSVIDTHPNIRKGSGRVGYVYLADLIPRIDYSYMVSYENDYKAFYTSPVVKIINLFTFMTTNSVYVIRVLDRLINYTYDVEYVPLHQFVFNRKNPIVDLSNYQVLVPQIDRVAEILKNDQSSRRGIIVLSDNSETPSCLISVQYLIDNNKLTCIANYRSQHMFHGYPYDVQLLNYLTTLLIEKTKLTFESVKIVANVADFHNYDVQ